VRVTISVVVVEDSKEILSVLEDLLGHIGPFRVVGGLATETDGTEWIQRNPANWEVAVLDLVLREGSGFNLIKRYRDANPGARIVVLSDYATPDIRIRCVELGADAVFSKGEIKAFAAYLSRHKREHDWADTAVDA
jgi:two-component system OmpR family response regulator